MRLERGAASGGEEASWPLALPLPLPLALRRPAAASGRVPAKEENMVNATGPKKERGMKRGRMKMLVSAVGFGIGIGIGIGCWLPCAEEEKRCCQDFGLPSRAATVRSLERVNAMASAVSG
ncbi:MAG: hypothetical protein Q9215_006471 [Flavoplaca cf. flavocitrina]